MAYDINKIISDIDAYLFDKASEINYNNIEILFSVNEIRKLLKVLEISENDSSNDSVTDRFNEIIIDELLISEIDEFNKLTNLNLKI